MLGADVVVAELQRLAQAELEDLLRPRREGDVAGRGLLPLADDLLHLLADGLQRDAEALQSLGGDAFTLVDEAEQDVLGADVVVVEHARLFLREHDHPTGPVGEPFKHLFCSCLSRSPRCYPCGTTSASRLSPTDTDRDERSRSCRLDGERGGPPSPVPCPEPARLMFAVADALVCRVAGPIAVAPATWLGAASAAGLLADLVDVPIASRSSASQLSDFSPTSRRTRRGPRSATGRRRPRRGCRAPCARAGAAGS